MHTFIHMMLLLLVASYPFSTLAIGCKRKVAPVASSGGLKGSVLSRSVPELKLRKSAIGCIGQLYRLVADRKLDEMRALIKSTDLEFIRPELFYRDDLHQTPLSIAWKRRDKEIISFLLSLGKYQEGQN